MVAELSKVPSVRQEMLFTNKCVDSGRTLCEKPISGKSRIKYDFRISLIL